MSRILVTGADGFIGQAVCRTLAERGHHVIAGTRAGAFVAEASDSCRLGDLGQFGPLKQWVTPPDAIVHLAARVHVMADQSTDPLAAYRQVNVEGTRRIAEAAERDGVKRLIFLSTVKVNGEATTGRAFSEADDPNPEDPYGQSKWEAEQQLAEIASHGRLETVILRVPLVYGPGVKANFLSLIKLCDTPLPLPFGTITENRRSFLYRENLADAIALTLENAAASGRTFMVSDGPAVSTADLVRSLRTALGRGLRLFSLSPVLLRAALSLAGKASIADRLTDSLEVDNSAIIRDLSWQAPWTWDDGIAATVDWYRRTSEAR
jgi:nucleoside-diphosphate-sugar epimerase